MAQSKNYDHKHATDEFKLTSKPLMFNSKPMYLAALLLDKAPAIEK